MLVLATYTDLYLSPLARRGRTLERSEGGRVRGILGEPCSQRLPLTRLASLATLSPQAGRGKETPPMPLQLEKPAWT
jgi:hypothetical protein